MFRQMMHGMLTAIPELEVVATATTESEGLAACRMHRPDLLLVDLNLPDGHGINVARQLAKLKPSAKIIVLSGEASTFICPAELIDRVHAILDKTQAFDALDHELRSLLPKGRGGSSSVPGTSIRDRLSPREYEIFLLIGRGLMSKEIGEKLDISAQTVQVHRRKIAEKLGTAGPELVQLALKHYHTTMGARGSALA